MNAKKYLHMFGELAERNEIPRELYDLLVAKIAENGGRMDKRVYKTYLSELEKRGLFDAEGAPFVTKNSAKTDGTYKYRHKNPLRHIARAVAVTVLKLIGYVAGALLFGVWRVKGRKKLKGLRSYITVSNHIGYLDIVLTRRATGGKKLYVAVAPHNRKMNFGGAILAAAGALPLPSGFRGAKPFADMLEYVSARGAAVHFYPEKSMWIGYKKPRPYKDGAFHYAYKLGVPVVPMLYCYGKPKGLRRLFHMPKMSIEIADPIYADAALSPRERNKDLADRAYRATVELYESFYGIPLEYGSEPTAEQDAPSENGVDKEINV